MNCIQSKTWIYTVRQRNSNIETATDSLCVTLSNTICDTIVFLLWYRQFFRTKAEGIHLIRYPDWIFDVFVCVFFVLFSSLTPIPNSHIFTITDTRILLLFSSFIELISLSMPEFSNWLKVIPIRCDAWLFFLFYILIELQLTHTHIHISWVIFMFICIRTKTNCRHLRSFHLKFDSLLDKQWMQIGERDWQKGSNNNKKMQFAVKFAIFPLFTNEICMWKKEKQPDHIYNVGRDTILRFEKMGYDVVVSF